jgi:hypothetical protein
MLAADTHLILEFLKQCANPIAKPVSCHPAPGTQTNSAREKRRY